MEVVSAVIIGTLFAVVAYLAQRHTAPFSLIPHLLLGNWGAIFGVMFTDLTRGNQSLPLDRYLYGAVVGAMLLLILSRSFVQFLRRTH